MLRDRGADVTSVAPEEERPSSTTVAAAMTSVDRSDKSDKLHLWRDAVPIRLHCDLCRIVLL